MEKPTTFKEKAAALISWTMNPDTTSLEGILALFTDIELMVLSTQSVDGAACGRIAWLEYARRRGYFDFTFKISVLNDVVHLRVEAQSLPIHEGLLLGANKPS